MITNLNDTLFTPAFEHSLSLSTSVCVFTSAKCPKSISGNHKT